ncbi:hypothetical protein DFR70_103279 [Nocardia tenerifensis]|uniref:Uncharacterized protein n=1 Tax=Nocardia tenerifensis TaxID=228006 RepID=A0A318K520_9NOCA|nr:hypothetical protein [Nocardia tenerifensis]PXX66530.1 hypothetical protein DFR70_103279 [Nocardia tenerifensis]
MNRALAFPLVALLVAGLTACGSTVAGTSRPAEVDIRMLDTGSYPTEPLNAHDDDYQPDFITMPEIAAMRLSDYVLPAYEIDPHLKFGRLPAGITSGLLPGELGAEGAMKPVAERNKLLFGFRTTGFDQKTTIIPSAWPIKTTEHATAVSMMVMQFPDAERAAKAATEFYDADLDTNREQNQPVALPKYNLAHAHWRPGTPFLRATLAHGSYVVAVLVSASEPDLNALLALAEKSYAAQLPVLDQLPTLTDEELYRLPWDTDHLLSRALNPNKTERPSIGSQALYNLRGIVQYADDLSVAKQRFGAMNADRFAVSDGTIVARTPDPAAAKRIVAERRTPAPVARDTDAPPNVPDSACVENRRDPNDFDMKRFTCVVAYRQYAGFVTGDQLLDVQQRAAAQYAIFANSR